MPTYEVECTHCGVHQDIVVTSWERFQQDLDGHTIECSCGVPEIRRVWTFPNMTVEPGEPVLEQIATPRPDGSYEVVPAARKLRDGGRHIVPRVQDTLPDMKRLNETYWANQASRKKKFIT